MRQYSNFLLFEGLLDNVPNTIPAIYNLSKQLTSTSLPIISTDCGTYLGEPMNVDYDREGDYDTTTKVALTATRIDALLAQGVTRGFVRKIHNCTATGGICQLCYKGTYQYLPVPAVGSTVSLPPTYVGFNDILVGDGLTYKFNLTPPDFTLARIVVFYNGAIVSSSTYTVDTSLWTITFNTPLVKNKRYVVKHYNTTTDGFLTYFAKTYSSALFGIKEIQSVPLLLPEYFYSAILQDADLEYAFTQLKTLKVPSTLLDYYSRITSKLEKALFIIYVYILYVSVIN